MLTVLYFARLRDEAGRARELIDFPPGVLDVAGLLAHLRVRDERLAQALDAIGTVRAAVNQRMAQAHTALSDGDEVALFPPVTGG